MPFTGAVPLHFLVADDMPEICEVLQSFLLQKGFLVTCALDGVTAKRVLERREADLALLDFNMPSGDAKSLTALAEMAGVPVILMSGHPLTIEALPGLPHPYLRKPFHLDDLERAIAAFLKAKSHSPLNSATFASSGAVTRDA